MALKKHYLHRYELAWTARIHGNVYTNQGTRAYEVQANRSQAIQECNVYSFIWESSLKTLVVLFTCVHRSNHNVGPTCVRTFPNHTRNHHCLNHCVFSPIDGPENPAPLEIICMSWHTILIRDNTCVAHIWRVLLTFGVAQASTIMQRHCPADVESRPEQNVLPGVWASLKHAT